MAAFEQPSAEEDIGTTAWGASRCGRPAASDHADPSASGGSRFGFWPLGRCCRAADNRDTPMGGTALWRDFKQASLKDTRELQSWHNAVGRYEGSRDLQIAENRVASQEMG
jgi:hypothetical protein